MTNSEGVVLARDDGVIEVPRAVAVPRGLVETVERIVEALGIPARDERGERRTEED